MSQVPLEQRAAHEESPRSLDRRQHRRQHWPEREHYHHHHHQAHLAEAQQSHPQRPQQRPPPDLRLSRPSSSELRADSYSAPAGDYPPAQRQEPRELDYNSRGHAEPGNRLTSHLVQCDSRAASEDAQGGQPNKPEQQPLECQLERPIGTDVMRAPAIYRPEMVAHLVPAPPPAPTLVGLAALGGQRTALKLAGRTPSSGLEQTVQPGWPAGRGSHYALEAIQPAHRQPHLPHPPVQQAQQPPPPLQQQPQQQQQPQPPPPPLQQQQQPQPSMRQHADCPADCPDRLDISSDCSCSSSTDCLAPVGSAPSAVLANAQPLVLQPASSQPPPQAAYRHRPLGVQASAPMEQQLSQQHSHPAPPPLVRQTTYTATSDTVTDTSPARPAQHPVQHHHSRQHHQHLHQHQNQHQHQHQHQQQQQQLLHSAKQRQSVSFRRSATTDHPAEQLPESPNRHSLAKRRQTGSSKQLKDDPGIATNSLAGGLRANPEGQFQSIHQRQLVNTSQMQQQQQQQQTTQSAAFQQATSRTPPSAALFQPSSPVPGHLLGRPSTAPASALNTLPAGVSHPSFQGAISLPPITSHRTNSPWMRISSIILTPIGIVIVLFIVISPLLHYIM